MKGSRLRWARERTGLSQRDLAARCQLGEKQIWRYENEDSDPTSEVLARIAKELKITADFLLGITDDPAGNLEESDLSPLERRLIAALREGRLVEAITTVSAIAKTGSDS